MSETITITGVIEHIGGVEEISPKFSKQLCVITTGEKYPQSIPIEFINDYIGNLSNFAVEEQVEIKVNLRGRKWTRQDGTDSYFLSLSAWDISRLQPAPTAAEDSPF